MDGRSKERLMRVEIEEMQTGGKGVGGLYSEGERK
jgi:hypothetical protein